MGRGLRERQSSEAGSNCPEDGGCDWQCRNCGFPVLSGDEDELPLVCPRCGAE